MTDKVQKILAKIELLLNETNYEPYSDEVLGRIKSLKELKSYIDSLQEEPVNDKLHEFEKEFFSIVNPYRNSHNYKGICVNLINWQHNLWRWLYWKENKKEPVSEDLMDAANNYCVNARKGYPRVMDETDMYICNAFKAGAKWQKENLWKSADGEDLPDIDREVIVFTQNFPDDAGIIRVAIAHRPNPKGWDGKSIATGKVEHYTPKTYGKGGWNIPDVKYWLDCSMPKK